MNKYTDKELLDILKVDSKTLDRFKEIQKETIKEAELRGQSKNKKIKVFDINVENNHNFFNICINYGCKHI